MACHQFQPPDLGPVGVYPFSYLIGCTQLCVEKGRNKAQFTQDGCVREGRLVQMLGEPMTGPPKKILWRNVMEREAACLDPKGHQLLWQYSEEAIGRPFFP